MRAENFPEFFPILFQTETVTPYSSFGDSNHPHSLDEGMTLSPGQTVNTPLSDFTLSPGGSAVENMLKVSLQIPLQVGALLSPYDNNNNNHEECQPVTSSVHNSNHNNNNNNNNNTSYHNSDHISSSLLLSYNPLTYQTVKTLQPFEFYLSLLHGAATYHGLYHDVIQNRLWFERENEPVPTGKKQDRM